MDDYILACLLDIRKAITDLESVFVDFPNRYDLFEKDNLRRWAVERKTEIIGEAMARIRRYDSDFQIPNSREIIATRNRLIHSYDSVRPDFLWSLVLRHIPALKKDIEHLISERLDNGNFDSEIRELLK